MGVLRKPGRALLAVLAAAFVAGFVSAPSASAVGLELSQTASAKWVPAGGLVTITVTEVNNVPANFAPTEGTVQMLPLRADSGAAVDDPYVSVSPSQGSCQPNGVGAYNEVDCDFGQLAPGQQAQVVAVVRVNHSMTHNIGIDPYRGNSSLDVVASVPPVVTGASQVKLRGLPTGCVTGDFNLTVLANVPQVTKVVTEMNLGLRENGYYLDWRRSRRGKRITITVPVSRIISPTIAKPYLLQITVQRGARAPLERMVSFGLCQAT